MRLRPANSEVLVIIGSGGMGLSVARRVGARRVVVPAEAILAARLQPALDPAAC